MKKIAITIAALFMATLSFGQTIEKSQAEMIYDTIPSVAPCTYCSEMIFVMSDTSEYRWDGDSWELWDNGVRWSLEQDSIRVGYKFGIEYARDTIRTPGSGGGGGGTVNAVVAGDNVSVDNTDPANPIVSAPTFPAEDVILADIEDNFGTDNVEFAIGDLFARVVALINAMGVPDYALNFGNFTSPLLTDNSSAKSLFEEIAGEIEANQDSITALRADIGTGSTNLSYTASATDGTVTSDTGTDAIIPAGSTTNASLMLPADKTKLDGIESGATADQNSSEVELSAPIAGLPASTDVHEALTELATNATVADQLIGDLITLSGVPITSQDLGTFTGSTITDDNTIKGALQELETSLEVKMDSFTLVMAADTSHYIFTQYNVATGVLKVDTLWQRAVSGGGGVDSFTVADQSIYRNTENAVTGNNILDVLSGALLPVQNNSKLTDTIQPPTGFTAPVPFWISRNEDGTYATQYDDIGVWRDSFLSDVPTDGVYYLDCIAGSDSNDGRTKATAKATMNAVRVLTPAPRRVYIKGGFYKTNTHSMGADTLQLIAYGGTPEIFRNITFPTWSLVGAGVYSTTQAAVGTGRILLSTKRDSDGVLVPLTQAGSLAELTNATDAYYSDGTTFYVILDGSAPTEFVNIIIAAATHTGMTQTHLYANGIRWYGGISYGVSGGLFTMRDCSNYYLNEGSTVDLMAFTDGTVYMYNSRFGYAGSDAIDWNGATTIGYEINCTGRYAGLSGSGSNDQISTGHAGSRVATINADYQYARSQSIAEINTGTQRWILGGVFGNCWEFTSGAIGALTDSEVWVDNAKVGGRQLDYTVWDTGTLYLRNVNINQNSRIEIEVGGTINEY